MSHCVNNWEKREPQTCYPQAKYTTGWKAPQRMAWIVDNCEEEKRMVT